MLGEALLPPFDGQGRACLEYVTDRGRFDALLLGRILDDLRTFHGIGDVAGVHGDAFADSRLAGCPSGRGDIPEHPCSGTEPARSDDDTPLDRSLPLRSRRRSRIDRALVQSARIVEE
jgi:hypothetical protein